MNKSELNNKLAELYGIDGMNKRICEVDMKEGIIYRDDLLIEDWSRLMDLAVDNGINISFTPDEEYVKSLTPIQYSADKTLRIIVNNGFKIDGKAFDLLLKFRENYLF